MTPAVPPTPARQAAERRGRFAETLAAWRLRLAGFRIIARRVKFAGGEIDLVARRRRLLIFVEVKSRASLAEAAAAIEPRQRLRISRAAAHFLQRNPALASLDQRFDAILLAPGTLPRHLADAWRSGD